MVIKNNGKEDIFCKIGIVLLLFLSSSLAIYRDIMPDLLTKVLWVFLTFFLLVTCEKFTIKIKLSGIVYCFLLSGLILVSYAVNNDNFVIAFNTIIGILVGALFVFRFDFDVFKYSYIKVMYVLCIISLVFFCIFALIPDFLNWTPLYDNVHTIFIFSYRVGLLRNYGMFWEPGAFQTFIALALLFLVTDNRFDAKYVVVFIVSMITTFSTTGYIALAMIFVMFFLQHGVKFNKIAILLIVAVFVIGMFVYFYWDSFFTKGGNSLFGKIINFFVRKEYARNGELFSTASSRYFSIVKVGKAFLDKPLFGYSYAPLSALTYKYTRGMNTCTFINWYATYGIFYGVLMTAGMISLTKHQCNKKMNMFVFFVTVFITTMSENYVNNSVIIMLSLYGLYNSHLFNGRKI